MRIAETSDLWWKNAVIYCLDVETFFDDDGDGSRIFNIDDGNDANLLDVSLSGLTLTGGDVNGDRPARVVRPGDEASCCDREEHQAERRGGGKNEPRIRDPRCDEHGDQERQRDEGRGPVRLAEVERGTRDHGSGGERRPRHGRVQQRPGCPVGPHERASSSFRRRS